jgi:hypothetical protein
VSGYLQRLAAQALGWAPGVRPTARLPLRAPSHSPGDLAPIDTNAAFAADAPEPATQASDVPSRNRPARAQPNDGVEAMPRAPVDAKPPTASHQDRPARRSRQDQAHPRHQELQAGTEPRVVARPHQDVPADARPALHPGAQLLATCPPPNAATGQSLPALAQGRARLSPTNASPPVATRSAGDSGSAREVEPSIDAQRAMTERASGAPRRGTIRRAGEGAGARQAEPGISGHRDTAEHAPDVHIHIGRVELNAVMAPAASHRAPPANGKKPMSLDEYLRRRDGSGS